MTTTKKKEVEYTKLEKELNKKYGNIIRPASFIKDEEETVFSLSPKLDDALNGGIPTKTWCIFSGVQKLGKTSLALGLAGQFQKAGRKSYFMDFEYRWKLVNAYGIEGFDPDQTLLVRSTDMDHVLTAEEKLGITLDLMKDKNNHGSLIIIDSTSAICPANVMAPEDKKGKGYKTSDVSGNRRSTSPKLLTDFFKQASPYVQLNDLTVVCISHLITNTSGYGAKYMEDGGLYMKYQCDVHLRGTSQPKILTKDGKDYGQIPIWDVVVSAKGPPRSKVVTRLTYGIGYDRYIENVDIGIDYGLIDQSGSWITYKDFKVQGIDNFAKELRQNNDVYEQLITDIKNYAKDI